MGLLRRLSAASGYRQALRHRDLRLLLGSQVISMTGYWAYNVALLAYVYDRTHSLAWVGAASTLRLLPGLVLSPYGGVLAERFERRRLMIATNLLCLAWQAALAAVALADASVQIAIALAALTTASSVAYDPCVAATIPGAAGEADLPAANALSQTVENLVLLLGPALGALVLVLSSPAVVFALNAASFAIAALLVRRMRVRSVPVDVTEGGTAGVRAQLAVGLRAIVGSRRIAILVAASALTAFLCGSDTVQLVGVATQRLGMGAQGFGWLLAALAVGGVLIAPAVNSLSRLPRVAGLIVGGIAAVCVPTLLLLVIRLPVAAAAVEIPRGAGVLVVDVLATIALQRSVPSEQLGRVFGVLWAIVLGSIALGAALTSPLIHAVGLVGSLWVTGLVPLALALAAYPALRRVDAQAAARLAVLEPRVQALAGTAAFAPSDRRVLERLAAGSEEIDVRAGVEIVREAEPADALYVLLAGAVQVVRSGADGHALVLASLAAGSIFGEIGLLERIPRTATVTALEPCRLLRIEGDAFLEALTDNPLAALVAELAHERTSQSRALELLEPVS
jgi:MFS family permease